MDDGERATCSRCGAPISSDDGAGLCVGCRLSDSQGGQRDAPAPLEPARPKFSLPSAIAAIGAILSGSLWLGCPRAKQPADAIAHLDRGVDLHEQGKVDEAIAEYRTAIGLKPDDAEAHYNLGEALTMQGKLDEAIAEYRAAIRLKPGDAWGQVALGAALGKQGKLDEEIAEYRTAIRLWPDSGLARFSLAEALQGQGKLEEAVAEFRTLIRLQPHVADFHGCLGSALEEQGKRDEAIAEYRAAIRLEPDGADAHYYLGHDLHAQGKLEEAIAEFRAAIRLEPDSAAAHNSLAWNLVVSPKRPLRDYDEGLQHARKAVELAPKVGGIVNALALAEYRSGHWVESIAASEQSVALRNGGNASDWFFLAMAHWQKGDKAGARKWFDKAVAWAKEKAPKNDDLRAFWKEAAELLGQPGPDASGPSQHAPPSTEKPC